MITYSLQDIQTITPEQIFEDTEHSNNVFALDLEKIGKENQQIAEVLDSFTNQDDIDLSFLNENFEGYKFNSKGRYNNMYAPKGGGIVQLCPGSRYGFEIKPKTTNKSFKDYSVEEFLKKLNNN